jgi:hypothetical protein
MFVVWPERVPLVNTINRPMYASFGIELEKLEDPNVDSSVPRLLVGIGDDATVPWIICEVDFCKLLADVAFPLILPMSTVSVAASNVLALSVPRSDATTLTGIP